MFYGCLGRRLRYMAAPLSAVRRSGRFGGAVRVLATSGVADKPFQDVGNSEGAGGGGSAGLGLKSLGIGVGAGTIGSLVGMGGGFVAIPFLTGWLGLTQHQAHGTSLAAVFTTGAAGSTAYALAGHIDYELAAAMAVAGTAAANVGARSTRGIDGMTLKLALGVLMLAVAPMLPLRDKILPSKGSRQDSAEQQRTDEGARHLPALSDDRAGGGASSAVAATGVGMPTLASRNEGEGERFSLEKAAKMFTIGAGSGFLAGVFGVGGGIITVPSISLTTDLGHKEVLGTSLAAMVLPALMGSATHFRQGNVVPRIAVPLALGTGAGAFLAGKYAARHLDESSLKLGFSCLLLLLGARTIQGARAAAVAAAKRRGGL